MPSSNKEVDYDAEFIIQAIKDAGVKHVHPDAESSIEIGKAVLDAMRKKPAGETPESGVIRKLVDVLGRIRVGRSSGDLIEVGVTAKKVTAHCVVALPKDGIEAKVMMNWLEDANVAIGDAALLNIEGDRRK
jgi:hypothetical protein